MCEAVVTVFRFMGRILETVFGFKRFGCAWVQNVETVLNFLICEKLGDVFIRTASKISLSASKISPMLSFTLCEL